MALSAMPTPPDGSAPGYFGVYPALVTRLVDADSLGRIEVRFPWLGTAGDRDVRAWATLCSPYADSQQGLQILPDVGSQVVVAFEAGNLRRPYIVGATWNGRTPFPEPATRANNLRVLRSRRGSCLEFDDTAGAEKVRITMTSGHQVVLDNTAREVTVRHASGSTVKLTMSGVEIKTKGSLDITASKVNVTTPMATFSGTVTCATLSANAMVMSPAYTPGAGNIW